MKVITLNTWGGRAGKDGLLDFFAAHKDDTDIFCLQEVWSASYECFRGRPAGGKALDHSTIMVNGMQEISRVLTEHVGFFRPHLLDNYGLMMFVHRKLTVLAEGELFVYKEKGYVPLGDVGTHARNIQYVTIFHGERPLTVINFHGLWNGKGKTDTDDRLRQSEHIVKFMQSLHGDIVLCGDFNLLPSTRSLALIEQAGLRNLVSDYKVTSTRTSFYTKPEKFADYVFVSGDVHVAHFAVMPEEVSDHAPLVVEVR